MTEIKIDKYCVYCTFWTTPSLYRKHSNEYKFNIGHTKEAIVMKVIRIPSKSS